MLTSKTTRNGKLKDYFLGIDSNETGTIPFNDAIRAGLENLGFSGPLNKLIKDFGNQYYSTTNVHEIFDYIVGVMEDNTTDTFGGLLHTFTDETRNFSAI